MTPHRAYRRPAFQRWLFSVFAVLATAAQLVVAFSPLAEGRDGRMASHVEGSGAASHYTHSEATCAACQARSIHGTTSRPALPVIRDVIRATAAVASAANGVSSDFHLKDNSRAPPAVI
jgi:hypothetical protein